MPGKVRVHQPHCGTRLNPNPFTIVKDINPTEVTTRIHQQAIGYPLAAQARPARTERHRHATLVAGSQQSPDLIGCLRCCNAPWDLQVMRSIMGERKPVNGAISDPALEIQRIIADTYTHLDLEGTLFGNRGV